MFVFMAGTWSGGQSAVRPERQYHPIQLLYISVEFIHVCCSVWGTRWRSWVRHCATSRKVARSIPDDVIEIFH